MYNNGSYYPLYAVQVNNYHHWMCLGFFNKRGNWSSPGSSNSWNKKESQQQFKAHVTTGPGTELRSMFVLSTMVHYSKRFYCFGLQDSINKLQTEDT